MVKQSKGDRKPAVVSGPQWHERVAHRRSNPGRAQGKDSAHCCSKCGNPGHRALLIEIRGQEAYACPLGSCPWMGLGCPDCVAAGSGVSDAAPQGLAGGAASVFSGAVSASPVTSSDADGSRPASSGIQRAVPERRAAAAQRNNLASATAAGPVGKTYASTSDGSRPSWSRKGSSQQERPAWTPKYQDPANFSPQKRARMSHSQPSRVRKADRTSIVGLLVASDDYGEQALACLQASKAVGNWPADGCPFCGAPAVKGQVGHGRVPSYECRPPPGFTEAEPDRQKKIHKWTYAYGSVFEDVSEVVSKSTNDEEAVAWVF